MNLQNIAAHLVDKCTTVGVCFLDSYNNSNKVYTYKTTEDFEVGDYAIVKTETQFKIVRIERVDTVLDLHDHVSYKYKWIVQKIDITKYNQLVETEKQFLEFALKSAREARKKDMKKTLRSSLGVTAKELQEQINKLNSI